MLVRDLKTSLRALAPVLTGATVPICGCVHFDQGSIWATNLEATIEVESELGVTVSVPFKTLKALVGSLDGKQEISLDTAGNDLVVETEAGSTTLAGLPIEDRPGRPAGGDVLASAKIEDGFKDVLLAVAVAASDDESREILTGVLVEVSDAAVALTATDSYRLHHDELPATTQGEANAVVRSHYAKSLPGERPAVIEVTENYFRIEQGHVVLSIRRLDEESSVHRFPNYRQLRPGTTSTTVVMEDRSDQVDKILRTFERLGEKFGNSLPVVIDFCPGTRQAEATLKLIDVGEHSAALPLQSCQGDSVHIAFNPKFLRAATSFAGRNVELTDALKPVVLSGRGTDRYALLMPVRLS